MLVTLGHQTIDVNIANTDVYHDNENFVSCVDMVNAALDNLDDGYEADMNNNTASSIYQLDMPGIAPTVYPIASVSNSDNAIFIADLHGDIHIVTADMRYDPSTMRQDRHGYPFFNRFCSSYPIMNSKRIISALGMRRYLMPVSIMICL